jgi:hypothetical protein
VSLEPNSSDKCPWPHEVGDISSQGGLALCCEPRSVV